MAEEDWQSLLPIYPFDGTIPKVIHQTYPSRNLPAHLQDNVRYLSDIGPDWAYHLYTDEDIEYFILNEYGEKILEAYKSIDIKYGAARADLFRYLLIYRYGGIYLDIKSTIDRPVDNNLFEENSYIISQWRNGKSEIHENFGFHREIDDIPGGEFQQWFIVAKAGHPFLRAVILYVLEGIERYRPWKTGVGRIGVVRLTGPIAYTKAISSIISQHPHSRIHDETGIGFRYSIGDGYQHGKVFKGHYSLLDTPVVRSRGFARVIDEAYVRLRRVAVRLRRN